MLLIYSGSTPNLEDWQFKFGLNGNVLNGLTALPFTDVESIDGLDAPDIRLLEASRDGEHGAYSYAKYYDKRTVTLELVIYSQGEGYLDALKSNFKPNDSGDWLFWKPPEEDVRLLFCKPIKFRYSVPRLRAAAQRIEAQLIFQADDPRWYGVTNSAIIKYPVLVQTGRIYPKMYPFVYGTVQTGGQLSIFNEGSIPTDPTFAFTGPVSHPSVYNQTTGQTMFLDINLTASQSLFVDVVNKAISINGVPAASVLRVNSDWVTLVEGNNELFFNAVSAGASASVVVASRNAWV